MKTIFNILLIYLIVLTNTLANDCATAELISSIPYTYTGTTVGAGDDYSNGGGCNNSYITGEDFVFVYTSAGNEVIGIELENLNDDRHGLYVFDGCPDDMATSCLVGDVSTGTTLLATYVKMH